MFFRSRMTTKATPATTVTTLIALRDAAMQEKPTTWDFIIFECAYRIFNSVLTRGRM